MIIILSMLTNYSFSIFHAVPILAAETMFCYILKQLIPLTHSNIHKISKTNNLIALYIIHQNSKSFISNLFCFIIIQN